MSKKTCSACNGTGSVQSSEGGKPKKKTCSACQGSGKVFSLAATGKEIFGLGEKDHEKK